MSRRPGLVGWLAIVGVLAVGCSSRDENAAATTASVVESTAATTPPSTDAAPETTAAAVETTAETIPTEAPEATEIGITADEIRVAAIADVDTPVGPLSRPIIAAVEGWAKNVNAAGGLAGRQVKVVSYDTKLNPDESSNAYLSACANEFAAVGSAPFVLLNPAPIVECKDQAGDAIGLPDIGALAISPGSALSTSTYALIVAGQDVKGDPNNWKTETYGWDFIAQQLGATPQMLVIEPGTPGSHASGEAWAAAATAKGWGSSGVVTYPDQATQSEATPIVNQIKADGVNMVMSTSVGIAKVMAESKVQGVDVSKIAWVCTLQCSNPLFVQQNADSVEGLYVATPVTPWSDANSAQVQAYLASVDPADVSQAGLTAYAAALSFQELVERIAAEKGVNGVTRQALIDLLSNGTPVGGKGLVDPSTVLGTASSCWVTAQVQSGTFVRVQPVPSGEFVCDAALAVATVPGPFQ